jgi:hypothetical protein
MTDEEWQTALEGTHAAVRTCAYGEFDALARKLSDWMKSYQS